ncbi:MAG: heme utilization cystosolic carrier protein HutX [Cellvibrionales bacterium]|nr:heme utilization cystosolic carrier protein HutX [Cellvibrionales bacterium]
MNTADNTSEFNEKSVTLTHTDCESLLSELPSWGKVTVIIIHAGSVFEFKGEFPKGSKAHGFYNLDSDGLGFEGHINTDKISSIELQSKLHRGRPSYALVFSTEKETLFKVFLGRDSEGNILPNQLNRFQQLEENAQNIQ